MKETAKAQLKTSFGICEIRVFVDDARPDKEHVALIFGELGGVNVLTRVHSECVTGDTLHSLHCDCGEQKDAALERLAQEGGIFLYMRQEGRGVGLTDKIRGYALQEAGQDTVEAHETLELPIDARNYAESAEVYKLLEVKSVRLLTNNPDKIAGLEASGIEVVERVPLIIAAHDHNRKYLETKKSKMNHLL